MPSTVYHCIPFEPVGDAIQTSDTVFWENFSKDEIEKYNLQSHPPLLFAATHFSKSLAFSMKAVSGPGKGIPLANWSLPDEDCEIHICWADPNLLNYTFHVSLYSMPGDDFTVLDGWSRQAFSTQSVSFEDTTLLTTIHSVTDAMQHGLQVFTFQSKPEDAGAFNDSVPDDLDMFWSYLSTLHQRQDVIWQNKKLGIAVNSSLERLLCQP